MSYKREKLMKIMNELVNFCLQINMKKLKIDFIDEGNIGRVIVEGYCANPPLEKLKELERNLNAPRKEELEEFYWSLMGDYHGEQALETIGVMVNSGIVSYEDNIVKISIIRDKSR